MVLSPVLQLRQTRRLIGLGQSFRSRLKVGVAGAAVPDVPTWIVFLCAQTSIDFTGALARHVNVNPGLLLERRRRRAAPLLVDAAIHDEGPGGVRGPQPERESCCESEQKCLEPGASGSIFHDFLPAGSPWTPTLSLNSHRPRRPRTVARCTRVQGFTPEGEIVNRSDRTGLRRAEAA